MFKKLFGKKDEQEFDINPLRKVYCVHLHGGKIKVSLSEALEEYDKENVICRECRNCSDS